MNTFTTIIALLQAVIGLMGNPAYQTNSAYRTQVDSISTQVVSLITMENSTLNEATTTTTTTPTTTSQPTTPQTATPTVSAPTVSVPTNSTSTGSAVAPQSTSTQLTPIDFSLVYPRVEFSTTKNIAYFTSASSYTPSYAPFRVDITANNETVTDPALPDGEAGRLTFKDLTASTTYPYTIILTGDTWTASTTGEFTTLDK